jgi:hypothetical protein
MEADVPGEDSISLSQFIQQVQKRHITPKFSDWRELQLKIDNLLERIPSKVPEKSYSKVSVHQFDFKILGVGPFREGQLEVDWSDCPCSVHKNGGCEFEELLDYKPPVYLRTEMQRHLNELWANPKTNPRWREERPSFKTISIQEHEKRLWLSFCRSTWHQFLGTNQAAVKDEAIMKLLNDSPRTGTHLELSPFSNNLGFAIAVIDSNAERMYYTIRKDVSIHPGLRSTAVGTQLHAYDPKHTTSRGIPNIFSAVREELRNEANIHEKDIRDLYISAWGVGTQTGTPELLFVCDTGKPLSEINDDVCEARVSHASEFSRLEMMSMEEDNIVLDYQLLAHLDTHPDQWEPEAAVASCFALGALVKDCVSYKEIE